MNISRTLTWSVEAPGHENCPPEAEGSMSIRGEDGSFITITTCRNHGTTEIHEGGIADIDTEWNDADA